jgi:hypothetical protein
MIAEEILPGGNFTAPQLELLKNVFQKFFRQSMGGNQLAFHRITGITS